MKKLIIIAVIISIVCGGVLFLYLKRDKNDIHKASEFISQADSFYDKKEYSQAVQSYKLAINEDSTDYYPYIKIAEIYSLKNRDEDALEFLKSQKENVFQKSKIDGAIGKILFEQGDYTQAIEYLENAFADDKMDVDITIDLAKSYLIFEDKKDKAVSVLNNFSGSDEDRVLIYYYLSILEFQKDPNKAKSLLNDALIFTSKYQSKIEDLKIIYETIEENTGSSIYSKALLAYEMINAQIYYPVIEIADQIQIENDEYYVSYLYEGISFLRLGNLEKAKENLENASVLESEDASIFLFLAQLYLSQNDQKNMIEAYQSAINIDNDNIEIRQDFVKGLLFFKLYDQATTQLEELSQLDIPAKYIYLSDRANLLIYELNDNQTGGELCLEVI